MYKADKNLNKAQGKIFIRGAYVGLFMAAGAAFFTMHARDKNAIYEAPTCYAGSDTCLVLKRTSALHLG